MADFVRQYDSPAADGVFISCTGLHVDGLIRPLEEELGKPVLTSNQCGLWGALRGLGLSDTVDSLGTLFGM